MDTRKTVSLFSTLLCVFTFLGYFPMSTSGHGRMLSPPSRMSAWRMGFDTPKNYNDHEMNCGGRGPHWGINSGKCGICGDRWDIVPRPYERPNGRFVQQPTVITATYKENQVIQVWITITVNHKGWYEFKLCDVRESGGIEATQECLDRTLLADENGRTRFDSGNDAAGRYDFMLILPEGKTCDHCVLQWKWHCGNDWGCNNGNCGVGVSDQQEEFYACADVAINSRRGGSSGPPSSGNPPRTEPPGSENPPRTEPPSSGNPPPPEPPSSGYPPRPYPPSPTYPQPPPASEPPSGARMSWREYLRDFFDRNPDKASVRSTNKITFRQRDDPMAYYDDTTLEDITGNAGSTDSGNEDFPTGSYSLGTDVELYTGVSVQTGSSRSIYGRTRHTSSVHRSASSGNRGRESSISWRCAMCRTGCRAQHCAEQCPEYCSGK